MSQYKFNLDDILRGIKLCLHCFSISWVVQLLEFSELCVKNGKNIYYYYSFHQTGNASPKTAKNGEWLQKPAEQAILSSIRQTNPIQASIFPKKQFYSIIFLRNKVSYARVFYSISLRMGPAYSTFVNKTPFEI